MRRLMLFICLMFAGSLFAQKDDNAKLKAAVADFDLAIVVKDSLKLKTILSDKLSYGHSNGWIQNKRQLIDDLFNGKITYKQVRSGNFEYASDGNTASVRSVADVDAEMEGKSMSFKLKVLQVWVNEKGKWILFARQSVKY